MEAPYAVVVWAGGGGAVEWGSGNVLDGAVLAARAHLLVITLNYRLGLLGKRLLTIYLMDIFFRRRCDVVIKELFVKVF